MIKEMEVTKKGRLARFVGTQGWSYGKPAILWTLKMFDGEPAMKSFGSSGKVGELVGLNHDVAVYRVQSYSGGSSWSSYWAINRASLREENVGSERPRGMRLSKPPKEPEPTLLCPGCFEPCNEHAPEDFDDDGLCLLYMGGPR
jgi:hypothetical protein